MKKFLRQDYFKFKRLKKKWRKPKGSQSKLRKGKSGSGIKVKIGHGKPKKSEIILVSNINDLEKIPKDSNVLVSKVGLKKLKLISRKAEELGIRMLNKRKLKRLEKREKELEKRKEEKMKEKEKKKKEVKEKKKEAKKPEVKKPVDAKKPADSSLAKENR